MFLSFLPSYVFIDAEGTCLTIFLEFLEIKQAHVCCSLFESQSRISTTIQALLWLSQPDQNLSFFISVHISCVYVMIDKYLTNIVYQIIST